MRRLILILCALIKISSTLDLSHLDPVKLQTKTSPEIQQQTALRIIEKYLPQIEVKVDPQLFKNHKDVFSLRTQDSVLHIRASSGLAAVWGFNYYLKKYCKSHIGWQTQNVRIPNPLPSVTEVVVASDRFRYYQNVCTVSYSFVWWKVDKWLDHVEWMALNGMNLVLAPVAQEAAWARIYKRLGMTDDEINEHFTGPAFLSWLRMGNLRGWGGPLLPSWHEQQQHIKEQVLDYMLQLGIVPVMPAFNGHVPKALKRLYPNETYYPVSRWCGFSDNYCCDLFLNPNSSLFVDIGEMFLKEVTLGLVSSSIFTADPFNEVKPSSWSVNFVSDTAHAIYNSMKRVDDNAVWLLQNWMFINNPISWPKKMVKAFLTSVPLGRILVLDLQSEQNPRYDVFDMYFGQPFIWCMLHNFGGTLGMFGNTKTITKDVYLTRMKENSTMIGIGLTPEGINQNYMLYDLMLESSWRNEPLTDLDTWVEDYAERVYGCNTTGPAWRYLLKSVYNFQSSARISGQYVVTLGPSFEINPWAWYSSHDLIEAWRQMVFEPTNNCHGGYTHDLVDVTRQVLQYRIAQLYVQMSRDRLSTTWAFNASVSQFLDAMQDMESILASHYDFTAQQWLSSARGFAKDDSEVYLYELNARNQITLWGPNGEISDYACKQWAELMHHYYIPRWETFLKAALDCKERNETFNEEIEQNIIRSTIEKQFATVHIKPLPKGNPRHLAKELFKKWSVVPGLDDLPRTPVQNPNRQRAYSLDGFYETYEDFEPTVVMLKSTRHRQEKRKTSNSKPRVSVTRFGKIYSYFSLRSLLALNFYSIYCGKGLIMSWVFFGIYQKPLTVSSIRPSI